MQATAVWDISILLLVVFDMHLEAVLYSLYMKNWINFYKTLYCLLITQYRFIYILPITIYLFTVCHVEATHMHMWALRMELWSSGLEASSFPYRAILMALGLTIF